MADTRTRFKGELSLGNVSDEAPPAKNGADLSQFTAILSRSWQQKQENDAAKAAGQPAPHANAAKGVTVPVEARQLTITRFRQAATELGIGCSITEVAANSQRAANYGLTQGQVRIIVEARAKKAAPGTTKKAASDNGNGSAAAPATGASKGLPTPPAKAGKAGK